MGCECCGHAAITVRMRAAGETCAENAQKDKKRRGDKADHHFWIVLGREIPPGNAVPHYCS